MLEPKLRIIKAVDWFQTAKEEEEVAETATINNLTQLHQI